MINVSSANTQFAELNTLKRRGNPGVNAALTILRRFYIRVDHWEITKQLRIKDTDWIDLGRLANLLRCFGLEVFVRQHSEYHRLNPSLQGLVMVFHQIDGVSAFSLVLSANSEIILQDTKSGRVTTWKREDFERSWWGKAYCSESRETIHFHRWSLRCYKPYYPIF